MLEFLAFLDQLDKVIDLFICGKVFIAASVIVSFIALAVDCQRHPTKE